MGVCVLACRSCHNKTSQTGLHNRNVSLPSLTLQFGDYKCTIKVLLGWVSGEMSLFGVSMAAFSLGTHLAPFVGASKLEIHPYDLILP